MFTATKSEVSYLRELAKKQREYAYLPIMAAKKEMWSDHNQLKGKTPMIHVEVMNFKGEILPKMICESEGARMIESQIYNSIINYEIIGDDRVISPYFEIYWNVSMKLFDLDIKKEYAKDEKGNNLGYTIDYQIKDIGQDLRKLKDSSFTINSEKTLKWKEFVDSIIGDILPTKFSMGAIVRANLTQKVVDLMGLESMLYAIIDYPDEFHMLMDKITNDTIKFLKMLETEQLLSLNNGNDWVGQGSFGFTDELPRNKTEQTVKLCDLWGYMDSQETVSISPAMFDEFIFPYYNKCAELFGLLSYGCCEAVNSFWEKNLSKLPNLRKISISPWCDERYMGEALKGTNVIYHRKVSPNFIGVGVELDEKPFRKHVRNTLKHAEGCKLEFSFRDVYKLNGRTDKPKRAVEILREEIENNWN